MIANFYIFHTVAANFYTLIANFCVMAANFCFIGCDCFKDAFTHPLAHANYVT